MSALLFLVVVVLSFLAMLVFLVLGIVFLAGSQQRKGWIFTSLAAVFLIFGVSGIVLLVDKTTKKIKTSMKDVLGEFQEDGQAAMEEREIRLRILNDSLFKMVPKHLQDEVPPNFYESHMTDLGEYWIPTVYPYGVTCDYPFEWGYLITQSPQEVEIFYGITHFSFDRKWFVCKVDNYPDPDTKRYSSFDKPPFYYLALQLHAEVQKAFTSEKELWDFVNGQGYQGDEFLLSLEDAYDSRR